MIQKKTQDKTKIKTCIPWQTLVSESKFYCLVQAFGKVRCVTLIFTFTKVFFLNFFRSLWLFNSFFKFFKSKNLIIIWGSQVTKMTNFCHFLSSICLSDLFLFIFLTSRNLLYVIISLFLVDLTFICHINIFYCLLHLYSFYFCFCFE